MDNAAEPRNLIFVPATLGKEVLVLLIKLLLLKCLSLCRSPLLLVKAGKVSLLLHASDITKRLPSLPSLSKALKAKVSTELLVLHLSLLLSIELPLGGVISRLLAGSLNLPKLAA